MNQKKVVIEMDLKQREKALQELARKQNDELLKTIGALEEVQRQIKAEEAK